MAEYFVSSTLSNILLTPFDREMRLRGYQLTRYADDWIATLHRLLDLSRFEQPTTTFLVHQNCIADLDLATIKVENSIVGLHPARPCSFLLRPKESFT